MSLVFEMAIKEAVKEQLKHFLYNNAEASGMGRMTGMTSAKRRTHKMAWMDFSDCELRIVNEVEKNPGMGGKQIIAMMSTNDTAYPDGTCEISTTKVLLANLVKRKVLISSGSAGGGYSLNNSESPPPPILPVV
jgi:hypothetical protein